ncbi:LysR family transcriptional regulator [Thalassococcus sp. S3]|uniref:LysR family transcriptional regulator n=1 Tax=Thalassococcus sp. S3 TaxID=2017482 RepID=UPI001024410B|nr:LysR family transcriptional regulator [Thalassococcus sp. S3]QBF29965.1 LysR family transcriptional regulator [Thalassococcus sp. S3]
MDELRPIRVFLEVADQSSFVAAARRLQMTPASVTRIIAKLEADLGQQLLVRTTRQVSLTSAGAIVASRYRPLVEEFDRAGRDLGRAGLADRGELKINAPMSMGLRLLPGLVSGFRLAYPNIALNVQMTDALVDILEEPCDLSIRISGPPSDKSTIWRKICEVPRHVIAAPSLFDRTVRPASPDEINPEICLSYSASGTAEKWQFRNGSARRTITAGSGVVSNNGDFLYALVRSGNGLALLPDFIFAPGLQEGTVECLLEGWQVLPLWLTLFYPPYEQLPPLVATFSDFFEAYMRDIDGLDFSTAPF